MAETIVALDGLQGHENESFSSIFSGGNEVNLSLFVTLGCGVGCGNCARCGSCKQRRKLRSPEQLMPAEDIDALVRAAQASGNLGEVILGGEDPTRRTDITEIVNNTAETIDGPVVLSTPARGLHNLELNQLAAGALGRVEVPNTALEIPTSKEIIGRYERHGIEVVVGTLVAGETLVVLPYTDLGKGLCYLGVETVGVPDAELFRVDPSKITTA